MPLENNQLWSYTQTQPQNAIRNLCRDSFSVWIFIIRTKMTTKNKCNGRRFRSMEMKNKSKMTAQCSYKSHNSNAHKQRIELKITYSNHRRSLFGMHLIFRLTVFFPLLLHQTWHYSRWRRFFVYFEISSIVIEIMCIFHNFDYEARFMC